MLKRKIQKRIASITTMQYSEILKRGMIILAITLSVTGCGQAGGLYLVNSEAEYNEGHFILPYRGDDQGSKSSSNDRMNSMNSNSETSAVAQAIAENEAALDEENALLSNDESSIY